MLGCTDVHSRLCPVVSDALPPRDCSPPDSTVHGISQATILEWLAISFPLEVSGHILKIRPVSMMVCFSNHVSLGAGRDKMKK